MGKNLHSPEAYAIAWIAALPIERAAAIALLDERHDAPQDFKQHPTDANSYTWGRMSNHNIVIASLPAGSYGTTPAATTASNLLASLPHIRIGLLVGIGGGVAQPPHQDIRLGDVVVSQPDRTMGGVIQYDLGKAKSDQSWERKGSLNTPPTVLLHAVAALQAEHLITASKVPDLLETMWESNPQMKRVRQKYPGFVHQGFENDRLFKSTHDHVGGDTCDKCDPSREIEREPRDDAYPEIHYGIIASGNCLFKDASTRDQVVKDIGGCLCVEMEAAGLMNSFPCLVIRGICDYADSHKNDRWQQYASATAAAYGKELLGFIVPRQLQATRKVIDALRSIEKDLENIQSNTSEMKEKIRTVYSVTSHVDQKLVLDRLAIAEGASFKSQTDENFTCLANTRVELLKQILQWVHDPNAKPIFWLNGMAGTGKSTISRTIASSLNQPRYLGASFFFKRGEADRGNVSRLMTTIVRQLADKEPRIAPMLKDAIEADSTILSSAIQEQFQKLIYEPLSKITLSAPLVVIIDALDECNNDNEVKLVIKLFARVQSLRPPWLRVFMTSRPELPIRLGFSNVRGIYQGLILHEIERRIIERDVHIFLEHNFQSIRDDYNSTVAEERKLPPDWPGDSEIKALASLTTPLFISAVTACRFIADRKYHPERSLKDILEHQGKSANSGYGATYLPVLYRQIDGLSRNRKDEVIRQFRHIVGTIITLANPLSASALAQLLNVPQDTIDVRLDMLHSVLHVPDSFNSPIRLLHLSFRDFLVDPATRDETPLWVDEKQMHCDIAINCLRVMEARLRMDICVMRSPGIARSTISNQRIAENVSEEIKYSCLHWVEHLKGGDMRISDGEEVHLFLFKHLLHWLEVLSLIGRASESLSMLQILQTLQKPRQSERLSNLLYDAVRFVRSYLSTIDSYPLQIYSSLVAFSPVESSIRTLFNKEMPDWLSINGDLEKGWGLCLQTLEGHSGVVRSVVFSRDSTLVASASDDETVRLWRADTGQAVQTLKGHSSYVNSVVFSRDSTLVASASSDRTVRLWRADTGQAVQTLKGHSSVVRSVVFSRDSTLVASASSDHTVRLWRADTGQAVQTLEGHSGGVLSVVFSPNSTLVASASYDQTVRLWRADTGQTIQRLRTDFGHLVVDGSHSSHVPTQLSSQATSSIYFGCGIDVDRRWIAWNGQKVLWLPVNFRPTSSAVAASMVSIGCSSGRVIFVKLSSVPLGIAG